MPKARQTYSYVEEWKSRWEPELEALAYNGASCDPTRVDPKVLHWVKHKCRGKPHFVKIINANAAHGKPGLLLRNSSSLTVPSPFVRQHFRQLERVVTLENERGSRQWRVSFGAPKRDPQWLQGWDRVAADNNFRPGDVVVFVLVEKSRFRFAHFDSDGNLCAGVKSKFGGGRCFSQESHDQAQSVDVATKETTKKKKKKKSALAELASGPISTVSNLEEATKEKKKRALVDLGNGPMSTVNNLEDVTKEKKKRTVLELVNGPMSKAPGDHELVAVLPLNPIAEPACKERRLQGNPNSASDNVPVRKFVDHSFDPFGFAFTSKRRVTTVVEKERAKDAAMAFAKTLTEPHFVTVMSQTQVYHDFHLVVPESFVTRACLPTTAATRWILEDDGKDAWDMLMKKNKYNEVAFHRKLWALFALHHLLEEGDVCVFRLKQTQACTLAVHMFRVVPISGAQVSLHHHFALHKLRSAAEKLHSEGDEKTVKR